MEAIQWTKANPKELAKDLIDKFIAFPWDQYDGVKDNRPNEVTLLDCAISVCMGSRFNREGNYDDWKTFEQYLKPSTDSFLSKFDCSISLEENTSSVPQFLREFEGLCHQLPIAPNWRVAKLTKVLHRKRPRLIPMLDAVVQMTYCFGPKSKLWENRYPENKEESIDRSIAALHELRKELMLHLDTIQQVIYLAHEMGPSTVPNSISCVRCLESLVYWRNR